MQLFFLRILPENCGASSRSTHKIALQFSSSYCPSSLLQLLVVSSLHAIHSITRICSFFLAISFPGGANTYPAFYSENKAYALDSMISYERES